MDSPRPSPLRARLLPALLALLAAACGPAEPVNSPEMHDLGNLEEVADLYRSVTSQKKKPPASLKDLARNRDLFIGGYKAIEDGAVVVYWGVEMTPAEESGGAAEVLAYGAEVPAKGGPVLLRDGTVKPMTAEEFQAAPKPPGPTSAPVKS